MRPQFDSRLHDATLLAKSGDFKAAKLRYAKVLTGNDDVSQLSAVLERYANQASWPKPMVGLFAASYQEKIQLGGEIDLASQWPAFADREAASNTFLQGVHGDWFVTARAHRSHAAASVDNGDDADAQHLTYAKSMLAKMPAVPAPGAPGQLYSFSVSKSLAKIVRRRDRPTVVGAASGIINAWRDSVAAGWDATFFQSLSDVTLPVGTIPYGNYIHQGNVQGPHGAANTDAPCMDGTCWGPTPRSVTMQDYVNQVIKSGWEPGQGARAYTFSTTSGLLYDRLGLGKSAGFLPIEMVGRTVFCAHDVPDPHANCTVDQDIDVNVAGDHERRPDVREGGAATASDTAVDPANKQGAHRRGVQMITEEEAVTNRLARNQRLEHCNRGCAWQFYLGGAGSGSHPHAHRAAFNILVRGKKRWFVFPPHHSLETIKGSGGGGGGGGSDDTSARSISNALPKEKLKTAFDWATTTLPTLITKGIVPSEFLQLPGEVVYVPEGWVHAVVNLEPSVGVAFEVEHGGAN